MVNVPVAGEAFLAMIADRESTGEPRIYLVGLNEWCRSCDIGDAHLVHFGVGRTGHRWQGRWRCHRGSFIEKIVHTSAGSQLRRPFVGRLASARSMLHTIGQQSRIRLLVSRNTS